MLILTDYTVFNDITAKLEKITKAEVDLVESKLEKVSSSDTVLGKLPPPTQILWALICSLSSEAEIAKAHSKQLLAPDLLIDFSERGLLLQEMALIAANLFWCQARSDCGFWEEANVGVRKGWVLVKLSELAPNPFLSKLLGF